MSDQQNRSRPRLRTTVRAGGYTFDSGGFTYSGSYAGADFAAGVCQAFGGEVVASWGTIGFSPDTGGIDCRWGYQLIS